MLPSNNQYLAPEVLRKQPYDNTVDWWCLGSVLYEMLFGLVSFYFKTHSPLHCFFALHYTVVLFSLWSAALWTQSFNRMIWWTVALEGRTHHCALCLLHEQCIVLLCLTRWPQLFRLCNCISGTVVSKHWGSAGDCFGSFPVYFV